MHILVVFVVVIVVVVFAVVVVIVYIEFVIIVGVVQSLPRQYIPALLRKICCSLVRRAGGGRLLE